MSDINNLTVTGRLTADAEIKTFPSGKKFLKFALASNHGWGEFEKATFFDCILTGDKRADALCKYLVKGKQVAITGAIEKNDYTDRSGVLHKAMQVTVDQVTLMSDGKQAGNKGTGEQEFDYEVMSDDELKARVESRTKAHSAKGKVIF